MSETTPQPEPIGETELREALEAAVKLQRRGHFKQAEEIYTAVLTLLPDEPNALNFLGVLRHQQGKVDEALHYIARSLQQQPGEAGTWLNLGNVLLGAGKFEEAVEAMRRVVELKPESVGVYNNLGIVHMRLGNREQALQCFQSALERDPKAGFVHANLGNYHYLCGNYRESIDHSLQAIGGDRTNGLARWILTLALLQQGERERAILNLQQWIVDEPDNPRPRHHLTALGVGEVPQRAPDDYVRDMFDRFAESFDVKLERLGYRAPQLVCDALLALGPRLPKDGDILDAGCGTGLCGPLLRPLGRRLEGVDLSGPMVERARPRGCYDDLHVDELMAFIERLPARWDIIASADTLIYFGDLDPLMAAVRSGLKPGGVLAASLESLPDNDAAGHVLQINGRYAHSESYLRAVAGRHGLDVVSIEPQVLRKEFGADVQGLVFTLLKPA